MRWEEGRGREREYNTLFYKDCILGSVQNLTTGPCWGVGGWGRRIVNRMKYEHTRK